MKKVSAKELQTMLRGGDDVALINVLPEESFREKHIPGSINVPVGSEDFLGRVKSAVAGRPDGVVVYCASTTCDASPKAARKLEQAGFPNVYDFEGGVKEWEESSLPLEGSGADAS